MNKGLKILERLMVVLLAFVVMVGCRISSNAKDVQVEMDTAGVASPGLSLEGAEYTFKYYDGYYKTEEELAGIEPTRTWVFATDENGVIDGETAKLVRGDELYVVNGRRVFPLGTITIQETKAPEGYLIDDTLYIQNIMVDANGKMVKSYNAPVVLEEVIRGDLKGVKASAGDNKRLANVPFKITSVASGESHVVVTDKNGEFNTSSSFNLHSQNTNRGETSKDGVWFGNLDNLDDERGALPYGSYIIEELSCEANKDKILIAPFEIDITRNDTILDLGTLINEYIPIPDIGTSATEKNSEMRTTYTDKETVIVDEVDYTNLSKGQEYTIKGVLMDKSTEKPFLVNGEQVTAEKTFTAEKTYGVIELEFTFDSSGLEGKQVVVFENLYCDGKEVAAHADIKDKKQTISFAEPEISTSATDKSTEKRTAYVNKKTTITDKITYCNLIKDREYTIKGTLMDKSTKEPLLVNGKEVTAEKTFIAENSNGYIDIEFTFDSSALKNKKVVVFEYLYYEDNEITSHADIRDKNQTIKYKEPSTEKLTKSGNTPKTGDVISIVVVVVILLVSSGTALFIFIKNRNKRG